MTGLGAGPDAAAQVTAALAASPAIVLAFFPGGIEASAPFDLFTEAARQVDGVEWMHTTDPKDFAAAAAAAGGGIAAPPAAGDAAAPFIVLVRGGGGSPQSVTFTGALDDDTKPLVDFVKSERLPTVVDFTDDNIEMIFESSVKHQVGWCWLIL